MDSSMELIVRILVCWGLTMLAYGAYPLLSAKKRKTEITAKKYFLKCMGFNFLIMFIFLFIDSVLYGTSSAAGPYILYTFVFNAIGKRKLRDKGLLVENKPSSTGKGASIQTGSNRSAADYSERDKQIDMLLYSLDRQKVIETAMADNIVAPGYMVDEACNIDRDFIYCGKPAGIRTMRRLEQKVLSINSFEEFSRSFPAYCFICGLMYSLGNLTREESDEMSRQFKEKVSKKTMEFSNEKEGMSAGGGQSEAQATRYAVRTPSGMTIWLDEEAYQRYKAGKIDFNRPLTPEEEAMKRRSLERLHQMYAQPTTEEQAIVDSDE